MFTIFRLRPAVVRGLLTFLCWTSVAWSAAVWGWRFWGQEPVQPIPIALYEPVQTNLGAVARVLGVVDETESVQTAVNSARHQLIGVVRDASGQGVAMIATGGAPARPYRLGAALEGGQVIRSISDKEVRVGPAGSDAGSIGSPGAQMVLSLKR